MNEADEEIQMAMQEFLTLDRAQPQAIVQALEKWIRARASVPDTDDRLWSMLKLLPAFVSGLQLELNASGLAVLPPLRHAIISLTLERGALWLKGGDWREAVLSIVSKATTPTT